MPTDDFIPAIQIIDKSGLERNITKFIVPYFTVVTQTTNFDTGAITTVTDLYETKPCTDLYDQDLHLKLVSQFKPYKDSSYDWYCPDLADLKVQNDPRADPDGVASFFIINYCDYAATNLGYDDANCETDHDTVDKRTTTMIVNTKTVNKYFDPNSYLDNEK